MEFKPAETPHLSTRQTAMYQYFFGNEHPCRFGRDAVREGLVVFPEATIDGSNDEFKALVREFVEKQLPAMIAVGPQDPVDHIQGRFQAVQLYLWLMEALFETRPDSQNRRDEYERINEGFLAGEILSISPFIKDAADEKNNKFAFFVGPQFIDRPRYAPHFGMVVNWDSEIGEVYLHQAATVRTINRRLIKALGGIAEHRAYIQGMKQEAYFE